MLDHAASVEVNLLDDGIDRYHCPIDSSLRVWSDCICVSHSIHRIQLNRICATDSSSTWSPPCQSKAAKLATWQVEVHVLGEGHIALDTAADRIAQLIGNF